MPVALADAAQAQAKSHDDNDCSDNESLFVGTNGYLDASKITKQQNTRILSFKQRN